MGVNALSAPTTDFRHDDDVAQGKLAGVALQRGIRAVEDARDVVCARSGPRARAVTD